MTDKETLKRIEEDANEYVSKTLGTSSEGVWRPNAVKDFIAGAKSERNKVLDEAIEKIESLRYIVNDHNERSGGRITGYNEAIDILESLKL